MRLRKQHTGGGGINEAVNIGAVFNHVYNTDFPEQTTGYFSAKCPLHDGLTSIIGLLPSAVLSLLILYCWRLWRTVSISQDLDEYHKTLVNLVEESKAKNRENNIRLPTRCHKEDSHNICLKIKPSNASDLWEGELQAAGVKVSGDQMKQRPVTSPNSSELLFFWNCKFETPGTLLVNVLLRRKRNPCDTEQEVLRMSHEIRVVTLYRQYATTLATTIVAALTFLLALTAGTRLDMPTLLNSTLQSLHI